MLIHQTQFLELGRIISVEHFLEDVLETAIIGFQDRVLGRQIDRVFASQTKGKAGMGKVADRVVEVVHGHSHARAWVIKHFVLNHLAVFADEFDRELTGAWNFEIGGFVLVSKGMTADDDRLGPAWNQTRHVGADDWLPEHHATQNVADRAVWRLPHLLQLELFNARFIGGDGSALNANAMLLDGLGCVDGDLVVCCVAVLDREVIILNLEVEIRRDQEVFDHLPDDAGHFVAIKIDNWISNFNLRHVFPLLVHERRGL